MEKESFFLLQYKYNKSLPLLCTVFVGINGNDSFGMELALYELVNLTYCCDYYMF